MTSSHGQYFGGRKEANRKVRSDALRVAIEIGLVSFVSYLAGFHFTALFHGASAGIGGLWSAICGIVVLQTTRRAT
jgi:hypothetical protein